MIRVIGLGSPFGDDQAGWRAIDLLRSRGLSGIDLIALDRPGQSLIHWLTDVDWLILVDAVSSDTPLGSVIRLDPESLDQASRGISSHGLHIGKALQLASTLGCLPPRVDTYGIEVGRPDLQALRSEIAGGAAALANSLARELSRT
ncbi:MAG: hydrogenase maturation protease [Chromatiaceae bacterium]|jgi:hydrogenase maturation protease